jgi:hypothetical protein
MSMSHAKDMVPLGVKPWKGLIIYARLKEGGRENEAVEKKLWNPVLGGSKTK